MQQSWSGICGKFVSMSNRLLSSFIKGLKFHKGKKKENIGFQEKKLGFWRLVPVYQGIKIKKQQIQGRGDGIPFSQQENVGFQEKKLGFWRLVPVYQGVKIKRDNLNPHSHPHDIQIMLRFLSFRKENSNQAYDSHWLSDIPICLM